jgi:hypothetical protein
MDALTADEKGLIACAIQHPNGFPVKPEYLADCERLSERGWLDRQVVDDPDRLDPQQSGYTALELGVPGG